MISTHGQADPPRSIVVIDVGATNIDFVQFGADLEVIDKRGTPAVRQSAPPYLSLDVEHALTCAREAIRAFDQTCPVDAVVPCTHGSAVALIDEAGDLVFPVMSYLSPVPDPVAKQYEKIAPEFSEVFAPTNPGALTVARQLFWLETDFPVDFAGVKNILPYAQYIAFRLCGEMASDICSLGAQTHLWAPLDAEFSQLARDRGWADLFAPIRAPDDRLARMKEGELRGEGRVLCGIHDSSANFLQVAHLEPVVLLSTGTWIIAFDTEAALGRLDPGRDQVANVRVDGRPIASARFMGGEEYAVIAGDAVEARPTIAAVQELVAAGTMALPSFTDSGGPVSGTGGKGTTVGQPPRSAAERVSLAALYTALMTDYLLAGLGATQRVVVDGVFAGNPVFTGLLAAFMPERDVATIDGPAGSARGAASLALGQSSPRLGLAPVAPAVIAGLEAYRLRWREEVKTLQHKGTSP